MPNGEKKSQKSQKTKSGLPPPPLNQRSGTPPLIYTPVLLSRATEYHTNFCPGRRSTTQTSVQGDGVPKKEDNRVFGLEAEDHRRWQVG